MRSLKNNKSVEQKEKSKFFLIVFCFLLFVYSPLINAQRNMNPYIKISGVIQPKGIGSIDTGLALGIHFNDHFSFQLGIYNIKQVNSPLDILALSISPNYRILKSKYPVSPVIGIDLGTQVWSNGNGRFLKNGYITSFYDPGFYGYDVRYKRCVLFGRAKLLADFKVKSFNILVGPTFNLMCIKVEKVKKYYSDYMVLSSSFDRLIGIGGEFSVMYTFPMKKRAAKKTLE